MHVWSLAHPSLFFKMRLTPRSEGSFVLSPAPPELVPPPPKVPRLVRSVGLEPHTELYRRLCHVRTAAMRRLNVLGEAILSNKVLRGLAQRPQEPWKLPGLPETMGEELKEVFEALLQEMNGRVELPRPCLKRFTQDDDASLGKRCKSEPTEASEASAEAEKGASDDWLELLEM